MGPIDDSSKLIAGEVILRKLASTLVDAMIVDVEFNVIIVSRNILAALEFNDEEVHRKNINYFTGIDDLAARLKAHTSNGCVEEQCATLYSKTHRPVRVNLSGFYLDMICGVSRYIILKVSNVAEVEKVNEQLRKRTAELDRFIYRTAHDLRGPLATIKGLINLLKIREDNDDLDRFILLLDAHANKLDERLFQLVYLTQVAEVKANPAGIDFNGLETNLRRIIEQNSFIDFLDFHYSAPSEIVGSIDTMLLSSLLNNALLYLLSLQMSTAQRHLSFKITAEPEILKVSISALGFETTEALRHAIDKSESIYTDMVHYPQLLNFHAAQKIAWQLKTTVRVEFLSPGNQRITVLIPLL
jgi:signal transduction histidine kinase